MRILRLYKAIKRLLVYKRFVTLPPKSKINVVGEPLSSIKPSAHFPEQKEKEKQEKTEQTSKASGAANGTPQAVSGTHTVITETPLEKTEEKIDSEAVDKRAYPIALSTFCMGLSLSCIVPVLPLLAVDMGLTQSQYGIVMSITGLSRIFSNIPLTCMVDRFGRRPALILGPLAASSAMFGVGLSVNSLQLFLARCLSGTSSAGQMIAGQLYLSDIANKNNRARTLTPNFIAWNAGFLIGPSIGGALAQVSLQFPFFCVGSTIAAISVLNYFLLPETAKRLDKTSSMGQQLTLAINQWKSLIRKPEIRTIVILQTAFWTAMSGVSFTLFPLHAIQTIGMSSVQLGACFTLNAFLNITLSKPSAYISDKVGRKLVIVPAAFMTAGGLSLIPFCTSFEHIIGAILISSTGNAILSTNPRAYLIDMVKEKELSQALALVSTGGDFGLFAGALLGGTLADMVGLNFAVHSLTGMLALSVMRFAIRAKPCNTAAAAATRKKAEK